MIVIIIIMHMDSNHRLHITRRNLIAVFFINFCSVCFLYEKYQNSSNYIFLMLLLLYLLIVSFMDVQTRYIYRAVNYMGILIGIFYYIITTISYVNYDKAIQSMICLALYCAYIVILVKVRAFGAGDGYLFAAVSLYLAPLCPKGMLPDILMFHFIISYVIFFIFYLILPLKENGNVCKISSRSSKRKAEAFAPSIAASTMLFILFFIS